MFPSWMRPTKMLAAAVAACLLLAAPGLHHGGAAARAELVRAQAGPVALRIDPRRRRYEHAGTCPTAGRAPSSGRGPPSPSPGRTARWT